MATFARCPSKTLTKSPRTIAAFSRWRNSGQDWDAAFTLLAPGAFVVTAAQFGGKIPFVEIQSQAGGACSLKNPWGGEVTLQRDGAAAERLAGPLLQFATRKSGRIVLTPAGTKLSPRRIP